MPADAETLNKFLDLSWQLHELTGKKCVEICRALLATRTLRELGQTGDGKLTQAQAEACNRLLERWIQQAKERNR
jgi:hypothetical protein